MTEQFSLSNAERSKVRKVITRHPDWTNYRDTHGITAADLTSARCVDVCASLGIDIKAALEGRDAQAALPIADDVPDAVVIEETPAAASPAPVADPLAALEALRALLGSTVDASQVKAMVDEALAPVLETIGRPALRVVDRDGAAMGADLPPTRHPAVDDLLTACSARDAISGQRLNVWIAGPAGSGKSYGAKQVAEALGLDFGFHGAMSMAHELVGFVDAGGKYHETIFVRLFRDGGVCLLDECDAGTSEALLTLNGPLANAMMSLPNGEIIERHPDFVCIAAANTWGHGASAEYVGRTRIDKAFLNRFGASLDWGYDEKLERDICGNPDWANRVQRARKKADKAGLKVLITPRHSIAGAALLAADMKPDRAAELTYLAGLTPEQVKQVEG